MEEKVRPTEDLTESCFRKKPTEFVIVLFNSKLPMVLTCLHGASGFLHPSNQAGLKMFPFLFPQVSGLLRLPSGKPPGAGGSCRRLMSRC